MAVQDPITSPTGDPEDAIACTLDSAGFATQSERWTELLARAAVDRIETEDGLRVEFRAEPGVEQELGDLVAVESQCCSWASWTVESNGDHVDLLVSSSGDGISVLHSMFRSLNLLINP